MCRLNLLKAKHWQIFLFLYGLPFIYQIILIVGIVFSIAENNKPNVGIILKYSKFSPLIILISILLILYWLWSIGKRLNEELPISIKLKSRKFKICLVFSSLYFIFILILVRIEANSWGSGINLHSYGSNSTIFSILLLFLFISIFVIFCLFYSFYFVAKTIKTAELKEKVNFADYIIEFLMVWLFPVGIWFIQPRINKLIK